MKTDALKKHHYWAIAGVSVLLVVLAFVMLSGGVSEAIDGRQTAIKTDAANVQKATAPGKVAISDIEKQKAELEKKKDTLWKENWEKQSTLFTWPKAPNNLFDEYNSLKFGAALKGYGDDMAQVFARTSVYKAAYEDMASKVAPTRFVNGWAAVLGERYIADWGPKRAEQNQLWLAVEDLWVHKALLDPIRAVNDEAARFSRVEDAKDTPLKRIFRSRSWQVEFEVAEQAPNRLLKAKLKNLTPQMQLLGSNSALTLKVWLDTPETPPIEFKIEGEFVPGNSYYGATTKDPAPYVPTLSSHVLTPGINVTEIAKVEQVLDDRTAPIRQIETVSLTMKEDANNRILFGPYSKIEKLLPPEFWKEDTTTAPVSRRPRAPRAAPHPECPRPSGGEWMARGVGRARRAARIASQAGPSRPANCRKATPRSTGPST